MNLINKQMSFDCLMELTHEDVDVAQENKIRQKNCSVKKVDDIQDSFVKKANKNIFNREFPLRCLGATLRQFVAEVANVTQTPLEFGASLSLAVVNSAIQGDIKISLGAGLNVPQSLYMVVTISPGENKEGVYQLMTAPLQNFQTSSNCETVLIHDIALGELAGIMSRQGGRATVINLNGTFALTSRRNAHIYQSFFLNAFSGLPITFERSTRTTEKIMNPKLTLFLAGPPELLPAIQMPTTTMNRMNHCFLFVPCQSMLGKRAFSLEQESIRNLEKYNQLIMTLLSSTDSGSLILSNGAKEHLFEFGQKIESELQDVRDIMYNWNSQLYSFVCRIVRILHCCKHPINSTLELIDERTMLNAIQIGEYYQNKTEEAFAIKNQIKEAADKEYLLNKLIDLPDDVRTTTDLLRLTRGYFGNIKNLEDCLEQLVEDGVILPLKKQKTKGKPRKLLSVIPAALAQAHAKLC